jgi:biotin synthase
MKTLIDATQKDVLIDWLGEEDLERLETLWREADRVRAEKVGDAVHLRGLIEASNHCARRCAYCGINASNTPLARYRMTDDEILAAADKAAGLGYGTVVIQSGEDAALDRAFFVRLIERIKSETCLAVTLSLGERTRDDLAAWRDAGADRYLLRFETSNRELFAKIHPAKSGADRRELLGVLRELGYEVGSGVMSGIPGQTIEDLANDILAFRNLDLDMIGIGPYLPHPATPLAAEVKEAAAHTTAAELLACKVVALARLACPLANIPSTTALSVADETSGRRHGLERGANVIMPNVTPAAYRRLYEIYPGKASVHEAAEEDRRIRESILALGRTVAVGRGDSPNFTKRARSTSAAEVKA